MLTSQAVCHRMKQMVVGKSSLESTEGGVRPPISAFPSMSSQVLRHVAEHSHAGG